MGINIRKATDLDAVAIDKINNDSWNNTYAEILSKEFLKNLYNKSENSIKIIKNHIEQYYVVEEEQNVLGFIRIKAIDSVTATIQSLYINNPKSGYGTKLLKYIFKYLPYKKYITEVFNDNSANEFYKKIGFKFIKSEYLNIDNKQHLVNTYEYYNKVKTNIIMLSGPDKTKYYNEDIKNLLSKEFGKNTSIAAITADFSNHTKNDRNFYGNDNSLGVVNQLKDVSEYIQNICLIDSRLSEEEIFNKINESDIIFLMGGNPHKQINSLNKYKDMLTDKIIVGVSAGSMNLSVYSYYSKDDDFDESHFYEGLGFTDITIDPHFDINNEEQVNEAIRMSNEHPIIGLPNESFISIKNGIVTINRDYYYFKDGNLLERDDKHE